MFRCPSCAVVWKIPLIDNHSLLMHHNMDKMTIEKEPITLYGRSLTTVVDLADLARALTEYNLSFIDHEAIPCRRCGEVHSFSEYNNAWEMPGDYFDGEDQLCHCGSPLWFDKIPGTPHFALTCEKCEWQKPRAKISGQAI